MRPVDKDTLITSLAWHDQQGMISTIDDILDIIEAFPTLTPQNEALTIEQLREMEQSTPVWWDYIPCWVLVRRGSVLAFGSDPHKVENLLGRFYRRPPERQEDTDA